MSLDDRKPDTTGRTVSSIPMNDPHDPATASIGTLVKDVTVHMSTLVRAEVELAKTEVIGEAKKAGIGGGLFIVAAAIALYASLFFFVFLGFLLDIWLPIWAAFGIVFLILLVIAIVAGIVGFVFFKRLHGPQRTIDSVKAVPSVLPTSGAKDSAATGAAPHQ